MTMKPEKTPKKLADLKPGDKVIVSYRNDKRVALVDRLTKHHVILAGGSKFRIRCGTSLSGDCWTRDYISIPEEGEIEHIKLAQQRSQLRYTVECELRSKKDTLTIEQLRAILEVMK